MVAVCRLDRGRVPPRYFRGLVSTAKPPGHVCRPNSGLGGCSRIVEDPRQRKVPGGSKSMHKSFSELSKVGIKLHKQTDITFK